MKMGYTLGAACAASLAIALPTSASAAVTISGGVTGFSLPGDPGLALAASAIAFADFTLNAVGDSWTTTVLRIGTTEGSVELDDLFPRDVSATFTFASPTGATGTAGGSSNGFYRLFTECGAFAGGCGRVEWGAPTLVDFGNGGQFSITLSNVEFGTPGSADVTATFELLSAAGAVPEPSTWAMLILGFGAVGFGLRAQGRRRQRVAYA